MTTLSERLMQMLSMLQDMMDGTSGIMRIAFCHINNIMSDIITDTRKQDEYHTKLQNMYDDKCMELQASEMNLSYYKRKLTEATDRFNPELRINIVVALQNAETVHGYSLNGATFDEAVDCIMVDNLIGAIRVWRQETKHGLREAKNIIEEVCYSSGARKRPS